MFCPECKAEYRPGFTRCADCDVDLVHALPPQDALEARGNSDWGEDESDLLRMIWYCDDESECVGFCKQLQKAGIYYRVAQDVDLGSKKTPQSGRYRIGVKPADYDRAKELLGVDPEPDDPGDEPGYEANEPLAAVTTDNDWGAQERARSDSYLKDWFPEDATVQVWVDHFPIGSVGVVDHAFLENLIHFRSGTNENGMRELFVRPEDEAVAREIIHQIVDGIPPQ